MWWMAAVRWFGGGVDLNLLACRRTAAPDTHVVCVGNKDLGKVVLGCQVPHVLFLSRVRLVGVLWD